MRWHCGAAHRWKSAAGGNLFRVDLRRQRKCDVPTPRETLHPQHLQAQEFRRQWGQTHGLKATVHSCTVAFLAVLRTAACSAAEPAKIAVCDKYDAAQVWTTVASQAMYLPADQGMSVAPLGRLPSVRRRPDGSFMLGTSALCSKCQMISFMA